MSLGFDTKISNFDLFLQDEDLKKLGDEKPGAIAKNVICKKFPCPASLIGNIGACPNISPNKNIYIFTIAYKWKKFPLITKSLISGICKKPKITLKRV